MNRRDWLLWARQRIDTLDARLLLQHVTGCTHAELIAAPEYPLAPAETAMLEALLLRRHQGEPLAYLTGHTGFMGLTLKVSGDVLVPRPETELLVELALEKLGKAPAPTLLDLGTGSGAIAIALYTALHTRGQTPRVTATDISPAALAVATENARYHQANLRFELSHWFDQLPPTPFDLIVSNPPYIHPNDPHLNGDGLRFEPRNALTDHEDGLACIRQIVESAPRYLAKQGWLLFEHGWDQGAAARNLLSLAGLKGVQTWPDLAGHDRISGGQWSGGIP